MQLTPTERDRLLIFTTAELARARRARGLALNVPEATALIADTVCEAARDGCRHAEAVAAGRRVLRREDVLPGVADVLGEVRVEAVFDDGSRLVVVPDPIPGARLGPQGPGAVDVATGPGPSAATDVVTIEVHNTAAVPITVTSHFHFLEVNPRLAFDRAAAYGRHLDVPAGTTVPFPPGELVQVRLVPISGNRVVIGMAGLVDGPLDTPGAKERALNLLRATGFCDTGVGSAEPSPSPQDAVGRLVAHMHTHPEVQR